MKRLAFALAFLALPLAAAAETATLVRDINSTPENPYGTVDAPERFVVLGSRILFAAGGTNTGSELWVTDGTPTGTRILEDICPGSCSSAPYPLGAANGVALLLVRVDEEDRRWQLWRSDGTEAGTYVLDIPTGGLEHPLDDPSSMVHLDGALYFPQCAEELGCELWRSDGTRAGTRAVKRFIPADDFNSGVGVAAMAVAGHRLYFSLPDSSAGLPALWTSDGTAAGTIQVAELEFGNVPRLLTGTPDGRAFFIAWTGEDGQDGGELWTSNGTSAGTRPLTGFEVSNPFNPTEWIKVIGSRVYFVADDVTHGWEIWRSDGTETGTVRVTDFGFYEPFDESYDGRLHGRLEEVGGRIVFHATDGLSEARLWVSDGRPESTAPLDCAGCRLNDPVDYRLASAGGKVFFVASDLQGGRELWITDGTKAGTRIPAEICQTAPCSVGKILGKDQAGVLFDVLDSSGLEMWYSDGTAAGTRRITGMPGSAGFSGPEFAWTGGRLYHYGDDGVGGADLWVSENGESRAVADVSRAAPGSEPQDPVALGDRLLFTACDGETRATWVSSGMPETTAPLPGHPAAGCSFSPGNLSLAPLAAAGRVFYVWQKQLWATDGTPGGAVQLTQLSSSEHLFFAAVFQGKLLFGIVEGQSAEIWKSDGTPGGTVKAFDVPGTLYSFDAAGDELYFAAAASTTIDLWRSDGTLAGTRKLTSGSDVQSEAGFTRAGSSVFFVMQADYFDPLELWKTDGTPAGTVKVRDLPGDRDSTPRELVEHQGKLYFFGLAEEWGWSLWQSDGTAAGTFPLRPFGAAYDPLNPPVFQLGTFAGRLVFVADDGEHGLEIWTSDGTAAGSALLSDIYPGAASSKPGDLTVAGGRLYFAADDGERGRELWSTDGTAAGTRLEHDLAPEDLSSNPGELAATSTHLYFVADDGLTGRELWSLPLAGGTCQPSPRHLCLGNGRYRVEAAWKDFQGNKGTGTAVAVTGDTGTFWFFSPANVEVILKVLDGTGLNGHRWVFYGALSSVEYTLTVTDTQTGLTRRYFNPMGQLASVGDTTSFGPLGAFSRTPEVAQPAPAVLAEERKMAVTGPCQATAERLCLNNQRFAVEVAWKDFQGNQGTGKAFALTSETGYFWFFDAANVELMIKVLDGTALNGKHWVFYGALSSVEYTITVTDTQTGVQKIYRNPSGRLASVADTGAF